MNPLLFGLLFFLIILVVGLLVAVGFIYWQLRTFRQEAQPAVLKEKLSHLEPVVQEVYNVQLALVKLQTWAETQQDREQQIAESIKRLENIIAGTGGRGTAGENILEVALATLPAEWQVHNFRVGNKTVEFGLRLPNGLVLPIDSKWPATNLLEQFASCDDPNEKRKLKAKIQKVVLDRAKEVKKYIDPNITVAFGVAVVPDAVYQVCSGIQANVFELKVALISYSLFVPYLLLVFQTMLKTSQSIDVQKLDVYLQRVQDSIEALQSELEGRFAKALGMLNNARTEMSACLAQASGGLARLRVLPKEELQGRIGETAEVARPGSQSSGDD